MRDELITTSPFRFIDYMEIRGWQGIGKHGTLTIKGHILAEREQEYLELIIEETWVQVDVVTYDGVSKHLFNGIVLDADMEMVNGTCILTLTLVTGSFLMDVVPHIRSFQDEGITYFSILDVITEEYPGRKFSMTTGNGSRTPGFVLQYDETDWEFARRLASHFGTDIYPDSIGGGVKVHFGEPDMNGTPVVNSNEYTIEKNSNGEYCYLVKLRDLYHMGDWMVFNGIPVWVAAIRTEAEGSELYHTYRLLQKKGLKNTKKYNKYNTGLTLAAVVTAVEKDRVQIEIEKDENKSRAGKTWFAYATPYSSPDGTGWYCMPETGDQVRVRIPSEDESGAYVANSVHMETTNGSERVNPDYKSIMNMQGKEILLTPKSLVMTNNAGMSIEILDDEGIRITSDKDIIIDAADAIQITSASSKLELYAKDNISLKQGNLQMNMDGEMRFYGARLNLN